MKNLRNTIIAHADISNLEPGTTVADVLEMVAAAQLDDERYLDADGTPDIASIVLARHGDEADGRYPGSAELEAAGADLIVLNNASANGLDMDLFGHAAFTGLDVKAFTDALDAGLDPACATDLLGRYDAGELSGMLANFVEAEAEADAYPDPMDRVLVRLEGATVERVAA